MNNIKKLFSKKMIRTTAVFAAVVIVLQAAAMLFMTSSGLGLLYPYVLALKSEEIRTGDADLGEYFSLHTDIEDAGLIILSVDTNVSDTYKLAADFLTFLTKFTKVSYVATYTSNYKLRAISEAAVKGDYEAFSTSCTSQRVSKVLSDQFFVFLEKIYSMNKRLTPDNKITVSGVKGHDDLKGVMNSLTTDLFSKPGGFSGEHVKVLNSRTPEQYVEQFKQYEDTLTEILGDKVYQYSETLDSVLNGTIDEAFTLRNLQKYTPAGEGAVFALLPKSVCGEESELVRGAEEIYGKVVVVDTAYFDCTTLDEEKGEIPLNEGKFPGFAQGIRIAAAHELKGFRNYYERVTNSFSSDALDGKMDVIGKTGDETFFIISGSDHVTFSEKSEDEAGTVGTVLVAPGQ